DVVADPQALSVLHRPDDRAHVEADELADPLEHRSGSRAQIFVANPQRPSPEVPSRHAGEGVRHRPARQRPTEARPGTMDEPFPLGAPLAAHRGPADTTRIAHQVNGPYVQPRVPFER